MGDNEEYMVYKFNKGDLCKCGHVDHLHDFFSSEGFYSKCDSPSCECMDFVEANNLDYLLMREASIMLCSFCGNSFKETYENQVCCLNCSKGC